MQSILHDSWLQLVRFSCCELQAVKIEVMVFAKPRDDGDCNERFLNAGRDVAQPCDRNVCAPRAHEYIIGERKCHEECFKASCDWSKSMCFTVKSNLGSCPLFDSVVLDSIRFAQNSSVWFVQGGSSRFEFTITF